MTSNIRIYRSASQTNIVSNNVILLLSYAYLRVTISLLSSVAALRWVKESGSGVVSSQAAAPLVKTSVKLSGLNPSSPPVTRYTYIDIDITVTGLVWNIHLVKTYYFIDAVSIVPTGVIEPRLIQICQPLSSI